MPRRIPHFAPATCTPEQSSHVTGHRRPFKRGRKPAGESRTAEIRDKLAEWKQMPEAQRPSLRALAAEIGTSHQLLSYHLARWEEWRPHESDFLPAVARNMRTQEFYRSILSDEAAKALWLKFVKSRRRTIAERATRLLQRYARGGAPWAIELLQKFAKGLNP